MTGTVHIRTFAAGALFTLACVVGSALASPTPSTHGIGGGVTSAKPLPAVAGPSLADQVAALRKRLDLIQNRESDTRRIAQAASAIAQDAENVTGCINGAYYVEFGPDGLVVQSDATAPQGFVVPTLDPECVSS